VLPFERHHTCAQNLAARHPRPVIGGGLNSFKDQGHSVDETAALEAYMALETAIEKLHALNADENEHSVEAVLVVGSQHLEPDGSHGGYSTAVYVRGGEQSRHASIGLLIDAVDMLRGTKCHHLDDDL